MNSSNLSNPDSLEVLTATLNQTLVETGRFFKSEGSLQSRAQMKRNLPVAHEKFQSALDRLSEQIFVAKAFLERDYEDVKARKAALRKRPTEDAARGQPEVTTGGSPTVPVPAETAAEAVPSEGEPKTMENPVKSEQQTDLDQEQQTTANVPVKEEQKEADADQPPASQNATGAEDINFDSLLNNQGPNEFDLNLDFGEDGNAGNESFFNATFGNQDAGSGLDAGNTQMSNTESGQDNNALQTGGDAFDLELEKFSGQPGDASGQFDGNTEDIMGPGESSFDDLFMESENLGGNGNENQDMLPGDGLMQLDELDDSWFS